MDDEYFLTTDGRPLGGEWPMMDPKGDLRGDYRRYAGEWPPFDPYERPVYDPRRHGRRDLPIIHTRPKGGRDWPVINPFFKPKSKKYGGSGLPPGLAVQVGGDKGFCSEWLEVALDIVALVYGIALLLLITINVYRHMNNIRSFNWVRNFIYLGSGFLLILNSCLGFKSRQEK